MRKAAAGYRAAVDTLDPEGALALAGAIARGLERLKASRNAMHGRLAATISDQERALLFTTVAAFDGQIASLESRLAIGLGPQLLGGKPCLATITNNTMGRCNCR